MRLEHLESAEAKRAGRVDRMSEAAARKALQVFYDYDKLGSEDFERRYFPALVKEARAHFFAINCHELARTPEQNLDLFVGTQAREALLVLGLVKGVANG